LVDVNESSQSSVSSIETESVEFGGGRVTYATFGDPDGVPVVALHGMPGSRAFGAFLDESARERGVRVYAPDRPGVGGSDPRERWRVAAAGEYVASFLDAVDVDNAGVVGFSAGGPHALACAAQLPERLTGTALLASPAPPGAGVEQSTMARVMGGLARHTSLGLSLATRFQATMLARQDPEALLGLFTNAPVAEDAVVDDATVADVLALDAELALAHGHGALATETRALASDWGFDPRTVGARVDVFHGTADENVPVAAAHHFEHVLPNPRLHRYGVDHLELLLDRGGDALDAAAGRL